MPNYYTLQAFEGTVNGEEAISLTMLSGKIVITNDDPSKDLLYKFSASAPIWCTLKPRESINMEFSTNEILISGTDSEYRIWVFS